MAFHRRLLRPGASSDDLSRSITIDHDLPGSHTISPTIAHDLPQMRRFTVVTTDSSDASLHIAVEGLLDLGGNASSAASLADMMPSGASSHELP